MRLVGGEENTRIPMVSAGDAEVFARSVTPLGEERNGPCCNEDHFRFDLLGKPKSPWNTSAAAVFCYSFLSFHGYSTTSNAFQDVRDAFFARVKSLRADYLKSVSGKPRKDFLKAARRRSRKSDVSDFYL